MAGDGGPGRIVAAETKTAPGWGVHYHHAVIDGLEPATAYRYRCRHDGTVTAGGKLRTAPAGAERFTFAAYGDQGTDVRARAVVGLLQTAAPAFTFCLGDLCYADPSGGVLPAEGVNHDTWDRWLQMLSRAVGAHSALLPVVGNHEIETGMGDWGYERPFAGADRRHAARRCRDDGHDHPSPRRLGVRAGAGNAAADPEPPCLTG